MLKFNSGWPRFICQSCSKIITDKNGIYRKCFLKLSLQVTTMTLRQNSSILPISCLNLNNLKSYQNYTSRTENLETVFDLKFDCLSGFRVNQKRVSGNCFKFYTN